MAVAQRSLASSHTTGATTLVVNVPAGVVNGDALIVAIAIEQSNTIITPGGWTLEESGTTTAINGARLYVFRRTASSEPASYTFTASGSAEMTGVMIAYTGVNTTTNNGVTASEQSGNAASTAITFPGITPGNAIDYLIYFGTTRNNVAHTPPAGTTERVEDTTNTNLLMYVADVQLASGSAVGSTTAARTSGSGTSKNVGIAITLKTSTAVSGTGTITAATGVTGTEKTGRAGTSTITAATACTGTRTTNHIGASTITATTTATGTGAKGASGASSMAASTTIVGFGTTGPTSSPPSPAPGTIAADAEWTWSVDTDGGRVLTQAAARKLTIRRRSPSDASLTLPGYHDEALAIVELVSDLSIWRNGRKLFRGRVGPTSDDLGTDTYDLEANAVNYRGVLTRRLVLDTDSLGPFSGVDAGTLAYNIVQLTQGRTNGDLGISAGVGIPAGVVAPDTTLSAGKSIAAHLDLLSNAGVFDWDIDPELALNIYPGGRAIPTSEVLDYGGAVTAVKRIVDPSTFANAERATGDDTLPAELVEVADLAVRPEGRWEKQYGDRDIHDADVLAATGEADLARSDLILPGYAVTLTAGFWRGPDHIWPGHIVTFIVNAGRLHVETDIVVEELRLTPGDSGGETVELALGWGFPADTYRTRPARNESRIRDLERT